MKSRLERFQAAFLRLAHARAQHRSVSPDVSKDALHIAPRRRAKSASHGCHAPTEVREPAFPIRGVPQEAPVRSRCPKCNTSDRRTLASDQGLHVGARRGFLAASVHSARCGPRMVARGLRSACSVGNATCMATVAANELQDRSTQGSPGSRSDWHRHWPEMTAWPRWIAHRRTVRARQQAAALRRRPCAVAPGPIVSHLREEAVAATFGRSSTAATPGRC